MPGAGHEGELAVGDFLEHPLGDGRVQHIAQFATDQQRGRGDFREHGPGVAGVRAREAVGAECLVVAEGPRAVRKEHQVVAGAVLELRFVGAGVCGDTVRVGRVFDLVNTSKVKGEFEEKVIAGAVQEIEVQVGELIDWLVERDFKQWQGVMEYLNRRADQHQDRIVGQLGGQFEFNRRELLASVGRAAHDVVATYDRIGEARQLADSVQMAVAQTAIAEVGALGLGTVLVVILHTTLADVSGVLAAGAVAALGLYILPTRRRKAKADLKTKMETLRGNLAESLSAEFEQELGRSVRRIREAMAPYTRFVRSERTKLSEIEGRLIQAAADLRALRAQVQEL